jgi:hypothetical protein
MQKGVVDYKDKRTELANMSVAQRRAIAGHLAGHELGADANEMNKLEGRLDKSRGKLSASGSIAYALGMDAKGASKFKGKGSADDIDRLAGELGLGQNERAKELLMSAHIGTEKGASKADKAAGLISLQEVKGLIDKAKAEKEKVATQEKADADPSYQMLKKMQEHLDKIAGATKNTEVNTKGTESLLNAAAQREVNK